MTERRRKGGTKIAAAIIGLALTVTALQVGSPASASFPGTNGLIAYVVGRQRLRREPGNPVPDAGHEHRRTTRRELQRGGQQARRRTARAGSCCSIRCAGSVGHARPEHARADNFRPRSTRPARSSCSQHSPAALFTIDVTGTNRTPSSRRLGTRSTRLVGRRHVHRVRQRFGRRHDPAHQPDGRRATCAGDDGPGRRCAARRDRVPVPTVSPDSKKVAFGQDGRRQRPRRGELRRHDGDADATDHGAPRTTHPVVLAGRHAARVLARRRCLSPVPSDGSGTVTADRRHHTSCNADTGVAGAPAPARAPARGPARAPARAAR